MNFEARVKMHSLNGLIFFAFDISCFFWKNLIKSMVIFKKMAWKIFVNLKIYSKLKKKFKIFFVRF